MTTPSRDETRTWLENELEEAEALGLEGKAAHIRRCLAALDAQGQPSPCLNCELDERDDIDKRPALWCDRCYASKIKAIDEQMARADRAEAVLTQLREWAEPGTIDPNAGYVTAMQAEREDSRREVRVILNGEEP